MKIMLNGATSGTNFGDFLFAYMFQNCVAKKIGQNNVFWYKSKKSYSKFFETLLENHNQIVFKKIDAIVFISGGYFCGNDKSIRDYIIRFLSYYLLGLKCIFSRKPYAIIGVDVAFSNVKIINAIQKIIIKNSKIVTVRNKESLICLKHMGISNPICTADSVFSLDDDLLKGVKAPGIIQNIHGKILLLHVSPTDEKNRLIIERVVPIVNHFIQKHNEFSIVITCDQFDKNQVVAMKNVASHLVSSPIIVEYNNPLVLCKIIESVDLIITTKLHVGIVGAKYGKSVISFSGHTEKIQRLYAQLNEAGRTYPLSDLTFEIGMDIIEKYYNKAIIVDNTIIEDSKRNFEELRCFIDSVAKTQEK